MTSTQPTPVNVEAASPGTVSEAALALAHGFANDPTVATMIPPHAPERLDRIRRLYLAELHTTGLDRVDVARDPDTGAVLGATAWEGPRRPRTEQISGAAAAKWLMVSSRALGPSGIIAGRRFDHAARQFRPTEPHWHLMDIAVVPAAQGRGVGGALLAHRLARVDADGLAAFLCASTPGSRRLYERYGFEAVGTLPEITGGATAMVRRPVTTFRA